MTIEERRRQKFSALMFPPLLAGGLLFLAVMILKHWQKLPGDAARTERAVLSAETPAPPPVPVSSPGLVNAVQEALAETQGTYGVVVKNFKTGESLFLDEHRVFEPASIYKLWIMAVAVKQVEKGQLSADDVLSADAADLNREFGIAEADTDQTEGEISFTVQDALAQMITVSDNNAALLLTDKVGLNAVNAFLKENGFKESHTGVGQESPKTTPWDTALFLEKLYSGQLANQESTKEMLDLLKWQKLNDGLPKYLPESVVIAHKTGEMEPFTHDAGIVFTDSGDYLIVVFTETDSRALAREGIAQVSRAVYRYFDKLSAPT
jgi:beta-lactamase class A